MLVFPRKTNQNLYNGSVREYTDFSCGTFA